MHTPSYRYLTSLLVLLLCTGCETIGPPLINMFVGTLPTPDPIWAEATLWPKMDYTGADERVARYITRQLPQSSYHLWTTLKLNGFTCINASKTTVSCHYEKSQAAQQCYGTGRVVIDVTFSQPATALNSSDLMIRTTVAADRENPDTRGCFPL